MKTLSITSMFFILMSWNVIEENGGSSLPKNFLKEFVEVGPMAYTMVMDCDTCSRNKTVLVDRFYIMKTEVSNAQYQLFLTQLRQEGKTAQFELAQVDSAGWNQFASFGEPFMDYYHAHPAYANYPVVNLTRQGALLYCQWLEDSLNQMNFNRYNYEVMLPTREEWVAAAKGGFELQKYSWGTYSTHNEDGCPNANFNDIGSESIHFNPETEQYEVKTHQKGISFGHPGLARTRKKRKRCDFQTTDGPSAVSSFTPNRFGLYNMSGNVAEMVHEDQIACGGSWRSTGYDIRCESTLSYSKPQPNIGFRPIIKVIQKN